MEHSSEPGGASGVYIEDTKDAPRRDAEAAELIERIRQGDGEAFEQVAREQAPRLYRLALRLTGRAEDAEDLVQETLVRALPALKRFEGRAKLSTYLVRALGNLWKNRLRSKKRSRLVEWFRAATRGDDGDEVPFDPPATAPGPMESLEAKERAATVREMVGRLEPNRRLALLLREVEEMSYEQIATATEVPVGTVRSRIARARRELRDLMGKRP